MATTDPTENRARFERFCRDVLERGKLEAIDELIARDVVSHAPLPDQAPGRDGFKAAIAAFHEAFGELRIELRDVVAERDKVVGYVTVTAVHRGAFAGLAPTGKRVSYEEMVIVRFEHGVIVEHWSVADTLAMMSAIGAVCDSTIPPPGRLSSRHAEPPEELQLAQARRVSKFFTDYAERFNRSLAGEDVDARDVADSFASHFVEASPGGVVGGKNGLLFRWMIPRGFAHYKKIGTTQMNVTDVEVDPLDALHALAKVHWDARYAKKNGKSDRIEFDVTYLLHFQGSEPKIFAYITGDEERVLKEHGLV
jgi:predicted ester cyclase